MNRNIVQYKKSDGMIIQLAYIHFIPTQETLDRYKNEVYDALFTEEMVDIRKHKIVNNGITDKTQDDFDKEEKEIQKIENEKKQKENKIKQKLGLTDQELKELKEILK